ncbi:hypothetical protein KQS06HV_100355 [Klebsiella quasipneumoniae subsp. similipneumoniae]|nr:hypothetical protein KQS06HV_100355 [Klebsiella quasipneumoniae subsp. similipneumoniae]
MDDPRFTVWTIIAQTAGAVNAAPAVAVG